MTLETLNAYRFIASTSTAAGPRPAARPQAAKVYQFPAPASAYLQDVRMDDPTSEEMSAHPVLALEIAAAALAYVAWLGWRLTRLAAASR